MKRRLFGFPILLILIEIIATVGSYIERPNRPGTFDIFALFGIHFIFLVMLVSFGFAIYYEIEVYKIEMTLHGKVRAFLIAFVIILLLSAYGYLRDSEAIIYVWDTDGVPKTSSGMYSGIFILAECFAAVLGLIGYNIYRFVKHSRKRV